MGGTLDELEAALAASWDRETLAVYGDHLQAIGDPRGELIALDLQLETVGFTPALARRRTSLVHAWLGRVMPTDVRRSWVGDSLRFGFVEDLYVRDAAQLASALRTPVGRYLRGITIDAAGVDIAQTLRLLVREVQPWLRRLRIDSADGVDRLDRALVDAVIAATPQLAELDVRRRVCFAFPHPAVRRLVLTGTRPIERLYDRPDPPGAGWPDELPFTGAGLDAVTELDLHLDRSIRDRPDDGEADTDPGSSGSMDFDLRPLLRAIDDVPVLPGLALPALRRLDLSRHRVPSDPLFEEIELLCSAHPELTHLRLPGIGSAAQLRSAQRTLDSLPALVEVVVAHASYAQPASLVHPGARITVPPPWPWPRLGTIPAGDVSFVVVLPGAPASEVLVLPAVELMELAFNDLALEERAAWTELWLAVARLSESPAASVSPQSLSIALEACPRLVEGGWRELRDDVRARRPFAPHAAATLRIARAD